MKLPTFLALSATGMAATAAAVWLTAAPAQATKTAPATTAVVAEPVVTTPAALTAEHAHFTAGKTLMMEGRLGHPVLPANTSSQTFLFVDVTADAAARARAQVPLNLAIVLDRSGSMKGKRLENAMAAARSAIGRLRDGDVVSVVTYNTAADVVVSPTVIDAATRPRILRELEKPRAAGDTCISCGIDVGMRLLGERPGMVSRVLLLSDGIATAGMRDQAGFHRLAEDCRRMGASITTIGVDVDYDERLMAALARDSNGRHFFVARPDGLATIFDQEMDALTHTVANGAELVVDLAPGVFADQVFDRVTTARGSQVVVPLGAFTAGDHKTVLVQLTVPAGTVGERPVASVRLRYDDLVEARPGTCEGSVAALLTADPAQLSPLDGVVSARVSSSETAAALETANKLWRDGNGDAARAVLQVNAGKVAERRHAAKAAMPRGRSSMVDKSFDDQTRVLEAATGGFSQPPAPTRPAAGAPPAPDPAAEQIRESQKNAFDLSN